MYIFGGFVPLLRGDIKWFFITWVVAVATFGLAWFVFPFVYNKVYIKGIIENGYVPADEASSNSLSAAGILFSSDYSKSE